MKCVHAERYEKNKKSIFLKAIIVKSIRSRSFSEKIIMKIKNSVKMAKKTYIKNNFWMKQKCTFNHFHKNHT